MNINSKMSLGLAALGLSPVISMGCTAADLLTSSQQSEKHPNIVLIVTDQQSYDMISAHKDIYGHSYANTPNLDRLVRNGISFTNCYCANPVSVPSRFSLFTGRYGGQFSIRENMCRGSKGEVVRPAIQANGMGHIFNQGGYETVYAGKVHLPYAGKRNNSKFTAPVTYGFQKYLTKDEREILAEETASFIRNRKEEGKPFLLVSCFLNPHDICLEGNTNLSKHVKGNKPEKTESINRLRAKIASFDSVQFYKEMVPELPVNFDLTANFPKLSCLQKRVKDLPDWYWKKYRWCYGELVSRVDRQIGKLLDAIDENIALKENTIIVFTSDHGEMQGAHQTMAKSLPYEECEKVPLIFCGPNIPKGKRSDAMICNGVDLLPTLCDLANINQAPVIEGKSAADLVEGKTEKWKRDYIYIESQHFVNVIKGHYKYTYFDKKKGKEVLINLNSDYGELTNIANDSKYHKVLVELREIAKENLGGK